MNRGLPYAQAIAYVGVKRRTFDEKWRPHLVAIPQGSSLIFDRADLDRLFDQFKAEAAGVAAANDSSRRPGAQWRPERTARQFERRKYSWAKQPAGSTPRKTGPGKSTSGGGALDFASAASLVTKKRKAG
jgi:hypothetical protein